MIPAPVRSVPQTDRWCLRLLTSMQRDCDTDNPLITEGSSLRGDTRLGPTPCGHSPVNSEEPV